MAHKWCIKWVVSTFRAYFAATYPPKECPSKINWLRFLALRHSSKESINHASVSAIRGQPLPREEKSSLKSLSGNKLAHMNVYNFEQNSMRRTGKKQ